MCTTLAFLPDPAEAFVFLRNHDTRRHKLALQPASLWYNFIALVFGKQFHLERSCWGNINFNVTKNYNE